MSSPFSRKFHSIDKDPLKMLGDLNKDGVMSGYEQKRQDAIEANTPNKMLSSDDEKTFTMSELEENTKKEKKQSKEQANELPQVEGPGNPDYEMVEEQRFAGDDGYDS